MEGQSHLIPGEAWNGKRGSCPFYGKSGTIFVKDASSDDQSMVDPTTWTVQISLACSLNRKQILDLWSFGLSTLFSIYGFLHVLFNFRYQYIIFSIFDDKDMPFLPVAGMLWLNFFLLIVFSILEWFGVSIIYLVYNWIYWHIWSINIVWTTMLIGQRWFCHHFCIGIQDHQSKKWRADVQYKMWVGSNFLGH